MSAKIILKISLRIVQIASSNFLVINRLIMS